MSTSGNRVDGAADAAFKAVYKAASEDALGMKLKAYVTLTTLRNVPMPQQDLHLDAPRPEQLRAAAERDGGRSHGGR
jgi:hypothetical protein